MRDEWLHMSVWIPPELQESPLRAVADHYVARGWTICDVTACDVVLKNLSVESMLDLAVEQRVHCGRQLPSDKWIIKVEFDKGGFRPNNRTAEFAYSSVPAPWLEHPVEIAIPVTENRPNRPLGKGEPHEMKGVLDELSSLSEAALVSWAVVSPLGRGPSLPELFGRERPSYVDLSTIFLSDLEFDAHAISLIPEHAHKEHWASGWLVSIAPYWGPSVSGVPATEFQSIMWRLLSSWAHRQRYK